jgi:GNAT superfamily N-acetyltransferase
MGLAPAPSVSLEQDTTMDAPISEIRPLRALDGEIWRALRLQALKEAPASFASSFEEESALDPAEFTGRIPAEGGPDVLFGLFVGCALHGAAGFAVQGGLKRRHKGLLWGVYVSPGVRGRGFARVLAQRVIGHARGEVSVLQTCVTVGNEAARRIYFELGFQLYGLEPAALRVDGQDFDEELLWLDFRDAALPTPGISDRRAP